MATEPNPDVPATGDGVSGVAPNAETPCPERWSDELGCWKHAPTTEHECRKTGRHRSHVCRYCDAMVIENVRR